MDPNQQLQQQQPENNKNIKKRGTITLQKSPGPPAGFYSPDTSVLTVGDGDLSFSNSISQWVLFKDKQNIKKLVATTYDTREELQKLYGLAVANNIKTLLKNGANVLHGIDVNKMDEVDIHEKIDEKSTGFDRIIWNFPHAGFPEQSHGPGFQWEETFHEKHITIIKKFFSSCRKYLNKEGLILMAHKTVEPFSIWNIQGLAEQKGYKLVSNQKFNVDCYPGYENRRGAGKNGGKRFPIQDSVQYVFSL